MALELQVLWCILTDIYLTEVQEIEKGGENAIPPEQSQPQMLVQAHADGFMVGERSSGAQSDLLQDWPSILKVGIELLFCTWHRIRDQYSHPFRQEKSEAP